MAHSQITELHVIRRKYKAALTRFKNYMEQLDETKINECIIEVKLEKIEPLWCEFDEVQSKLEVLQPENAEEFKQRETFEEEYFWTVAEARRLTRKVEMESSTPLSDSDRSQTKVVKLPSIELPTFDGKCEEFQSFKEEFNSLVGSRKDLDEVQKLRYLVRSLKGDAALVIKSMEVTGRNYSLAWEGLEERFCNKRKVVARHIKAILDSEKIERASSYKIQCLLDTVLSHLRSLKSMERPVEQWDDQILIRKLDSATRQRWEQECSKAELPTLNKLIKFLEARIDVLDAVEISKNDKRVETFRRSSFNSKSSYSAVELLDDHDSRSSTPETSCEFCKGSHKIFFCKRFKGLPIKLRIKEIKMLRLCPKCLSKHAGNDKCRGPNCRRCNKPHNTLLHDSDNPSSDFQSRQGDEISREGDNAVINTSVVSYKHRPTVLLSTAIVQVMNEDEKWIDCRVLLDSGSQSNFITNEAVKKLGTSPKSNNVTVCGLGIKASRPLKSITCLIKSKYEPLQLNTEFLVLPRITLPLPDTPIDSSNWQIPNDIFLADPKFNIPAPVDLLLGNEHFFNLIKGQQINLGPNIPKLQLSAFGWVLGGRFVKGAGLAKSVCNLSVEDGLRKFWEIEEFSGQQILSAEEKECERIFNETSKRDSSGRFVVKLPAKPNIMMLGESEQAAKLRFFKLEGRLSKDSTLKTAYSAFMKEYETLDHMRLTQLAPIYYLPHHCVHNQFSSTTKLRVVFDASARTTTGLSLNEVLMTGPCIQQDLFSIIMRFRMHRFVMTSDITKMYRQIMIAEEDKGLQQIFWRATSKEPLKKYCLQTVTYGAAPASYLATRCLKQLALDNQLCYPDAARTILEDFYMDDLLTGAGDLDQLIKLQREIVAILNTAGFELHKWCANNSKTLKDIAPDKREGKYIPDAKSAIKTLGLWWMPEEDLFKFSITISEQVIWTKRLVLAEISKIFDPLGFLSPIVIKGKIFLQKVWKDALNWDEALPPPLLEEWETIKKNVITLEELTIPRALRRHWNGDVQLHGFCDASQVAYGAAVYIRTTDRDGTFHSQLLCSKSRVTPLKKLSLPRLELCGTLLLGSENKPSSKCRVIASNFME